MINFSRSVQRQRRYKQQQHQQQKQNTSQATSFLVAHLIRPLLISTISRVYMYISHHNLNILMGNKEQINHHQVVKPMILCVPPYLNLLLSRVCVCLIRFGDRFFVICLLLFRFRGKGREREGRKEERDSKNSNSCLFALQERGLPLTYQDGEIFDQNKNNKKKEERTRGLVTDNIRVGIHDADTERQEERE